MKRSFVIGAALALAAMSLVGCMRSKAPVQFHAQGQPEKLSDWHVVESDGKRLHLNHEVEPYALNTTLFSDYAHKLRTIWMPKGKPAKYDATEALDFPVGTIISKTFYYPRAGDAVVRVAESAGETLDGLDLTKVRLIETRLLVRRESGWVALPYVWNAEQTEATLARAGETIPLTLQKPDGSAKQSFAYMVPDENQCAGCHGTNNTTRELHPIGPKARHLNRENPWHPGENQLVRMVALGRLEGLPKDNVPYNARFDDASASVEDRARAYLDINCGHCHNKVGPADTSGLWLDAGTDDARRLGLCKPPVAAGQGTGDHMFDIVPGRPQDSILVYRMNSLDPGAMMPELGRSTVHEEGVSLIRDWIAAWLGSCSSEAVAAQESVAAK
ncbi:SO2930 family diheme c-type cytochrome [Lysobacter sp. LF1]|uniref:SO2930 family diheme c-type cytochrome n=1 Tax=Lysobacter stagni TaxID=3045172 RepID=A0ABT6XBW4_9GAMM|nr:SO2930 family diheme c-type cytochrome [Lysobacter sp. LF1]MDI9237514.1 SO2930 family diheme c-type cytochrome [Lysobacter sp. LF1]